MRSAPFFLSISCLRNGGGCGVVGRKAARLFRYRYVHGDGLAASVFQVEAFQPQLGVSWNVHAQHFMFQRVVYADGLLVQNERPAPQRLFLNAPIARCELDGEAQHLAPDGRDVQPGRRDVTPVPDPHFEKRLDTPLVFERVVARRATSVALDVEHILGVYRDVGHVAVADDAVFACAEGGLQLHRRAIGEVHDIACLLQFLARRPDVDSSFLPTFVTQSDAGVLPQQLHRHVVAVLDDDGRRILRVRVQHHGRASAHARRDVEVAIERVCRQRVGENVVVFALGGNLDGPRRLLRLIAARDEKG